MAKKLTIELGTLPAYSLRLLEDLEQLVEGCYDSNREYGAQEVADKVAEMVVDAIYQHRFNYIVKEE